MNEIIERWNALEDLEREHQLFDAYVKARSEYLQAVRDRTKPEHNIPSLEPYYKAERAAFTDYLAHRSKIRPE